MDRIGWYRLPKSGHPYFGPIPDGIDELTEPFPVVEGPSRPPLSANKDAWVEWAVECGWDRQDARNATKATLIDELGSVDLGEQIIDPADSSPADVAPSVLIDQQGSDALEVGAGPAGDGTPEDKLGNDNRVVGHKDDGTP